MTDPTASSLDRLMWEKGTSLVNGLHSYRGGIWALAINGLVQTTLGIVFSILGFTLKEAAGTPFMVIGPILFVCGVCLGGGAYLWSRRLGKVHKPQAKLNADGTRLVVRILSHIGWVNTSSYRYGAMSGPSLWSFGGRRTAEQVLTPAAFSLLDACAFQVLRILSSLNSGASFHAQTLESLRPSIFAAVDETLVGILNQVGTMERIPEGGSSIRGQVEADVASLKELADRVEVMQAAAPKIVDHLAGPSPIQNVLDQLRLDEAARKELGPEEELPNRLG